MLDTSNWTLICKTIFSRGGGRFLGLMIPIVMVAVCLLLPLKPGPRPVRTVAKNMRVAFDPDLGSFQVPYKRITPWRTQYPVTHDGLITNPEPLLRKGKPVSVLIAGASSSYMNRYPIFVQEEGRKKGLPIDLFQQANLNHTLFDCIDGVIYTLEHSARHFDYVFVMPAPEVTVPRWLTSQDFLGLLGNGMSLRFLGAKNEFDTPGKLDELEAEYNRRVTELRNSAANEAFEKFRELPAIGKKGEARLWTEGLNELYRRVGTKSKFVLISHFTRDKGHLELATVLSDTLSSSAKEKNWIFVNALHHVDRFPPSEFENPWHLNPVGEKKLGKLIFDVVFGKKVSAVPLS